MLSRLLKRHPLSKQTDHTVAENTAVTNIAVANIVVMSIAGIIVATDTTVMDMDMATNVIVITGMENGMTGAASIRNAGIQNKGATVLF